MQSFWWSGGGSMEVYFSLSTKPGVFVSPLNIMRISREPFHMEPYKLSIKTWRFHKIISYFSPLSDLRNGTLTRHVVGFRCTCCCSRREIDSWIVTGFKNWTAWKHLILNTGPRNLPSTSNSSFGTSWTFNSNGNFALGATAFVWEVRMAERAATRCDGVSWRNFETANYCVCWALRYISLSNRKEKVRPFHVGRVIVFEVLTTTYVPGSIHVFPIIRLLVNQLFYH